MCVLVCVHVHVYVCVGLCVCVCVCVCACVRSRARICAMCSSVHTCVRYAGFKVICMEARVLCGVPTCVRCVCFWEDYACVNVICMKEDTVQVLIGHRIGCM